MNFLPRGGALVAAVLLSASAVFAEADISGTVINKTTMQPMDFVTVSLLDAKTGAGTEFGTMTDENGRFVIAGAPAGQYIVRVMNVGSVNQERPVTLDDADIDLGHIELADDANLLQEVVVTGQRASVAVEADRRVFNVSSSIASAGASAEELLSSVPSVEVSHDGDISLRGDSNVLVWIDGKESGMTSENRAQMLRQLPADAVESIEVLTNASARHSAESAGGIINIRLKKNSRAAYYGSADVMADSHGSLGANVSFSQTRGDFEWFGALGGKIQRTPKGADSKREYFDGYSLDSRTDSRERDNNMFLRLGASYLPNARNAFSLSAIGTYGYLKLRSDASHTANRPDHWTSLLGSGRETNHNLGANILATYKHTFAPGHSLDLSLSYNVWDRPLSSSFREEAAYPDATPVVEFERQTQDVKLRNTEAALDYSNQLAPWLRLDAGYKGNYNRENSPSTYFAAPAGQELLPVPDLFNRFKYETDITAFYVNASGSSGAFSYAAGLRAEAWTTRTRSLGYETTYSGSPDRKSNDFALFPSASLGWKLSADNELNVSYTRRIRRPYGPQLNTFVNMSDPAEIHLGNPLILPEYSNSVEISYLGRFGAQSLSVAAYIRSNTDMISHISFLAPLATDPEVMTMYYGHANVGDRLNAGFEVISRNSLFGRLTLTTTLNLYNSHIKGWSTLYPLEGAMYPISGPSRDKFVWSVRSQASLRLPWNLTFQIAGRYRSQRIMAQGTIEPSWNVEAAIRKNIGPWSLSLVCKDLFDSERSKEVLFGDVYTQTVEKWSAGRTLRVGVAYTFGKSSPSKAACSHQHIDTGGYADDHVH